MDKYIKVGKFLSLILRHSAEIIGIKLDKVTGVNVGKRHGKPIILEILSGAMFENWYKFYLSENGVWLTDNVPVIYVKF